MQKSRAMKKKFIIWINRLFKKEKISLDVRAEHLFKAYQKITEDCSPVSRARTIDLFKSLVINDLEIEAKCYKEFSEKNLRHSKQCERALAETFNVYTVEASELNEGVINSGNIDQVYQKQ